MISDNASTAMQAMVFAAGLGTRLKPLTDRMPKALVEVAGKPLLWHVLKRLEQAGASRVVVNVHHFAGQIISYLEEHSFALDLHVSDESSLLLDTGGGLKKASALFQTDRPVLIHNVDILSNVDLTGFYQKAEGKTALLVSSRPSSRQLLFDIDMRLRRYAFSGIHAFSPTLFPYMQSWPDRFGIIDFYLSVCHQVEIKGVVKEDLRLMDVGKLDTLKAAEEFLHSL